MGPAKLRWGPVERVAGGWAGYQAATMAPDGTATVMWKGPGGGLVSREAPPGQPWKARQTIPPSSFAGWAGDVTTGVDANGTIIAVWDSEDLRTERYSFWSAQRPAGGSWSRPVPLGDWVREEPFDWDLAVNPSGAAVFTWEGDIGTRALYRSENGTWSTPTSLPDAASPIEIAIDADGLATIAFPSIDDGLLTLVQGSSAGWQAPIELAAKVGFAATGTKIGSTERLFDIGAARAGEVFVVWQDARFRFITGRLLGEKITGQRTLTKTGGYAAALQMTAARDGSATLVWRLGKPATYEGDGVTCDEGCGPDGYSRVHDASDVHAAWQSATGKFSNPEVIKAEGSGCDSAGLVLAIAGNGRGDTVIAHTDVHPSGLAVAYRSEGAKAFLPQDGVVHHNSGPGCDESSTVALADNGSVMLTWQNLHSSTGELEPTVLLARRATISH